MELEEKLRVLAVDHHKAVLEVYELVCKSIDEKFGILHFVGAVDCRSGYKAIKDHDHNPFNIAIVDINLKRCDETMIQSGFDLALTIRSCMSGCKIIFITMNKEQEVCKKILREVQPEGFIHKIDCNFEDLVQGFTQILNGETFYSKSILQLNIAQTEDSGYTPS